jgi:parvulin-like peptidyl-prolyl isomerase
MNPISFFSRFLINVFVLLITYSGVAFAENRTNFSINGKAVPQIVATVNGTSLTSDLLKREMIAYQLLSNRQGKNTKSEDERKIAQGLLMKAIDDELIYQEGLKSNITIDSVVIDRELNNIKEQFPDKKLFLAALAAQRLTFEILKKKIRKTLIHEEFVRTNIAPKATVDDIDVKSFYNQNKDTFLEPESFKIRHIYVTTTGTSGEDIESKDDRAKAKEIIDWVNQQARKKINQAASTLKSGISFAIVAKEFSEDAKTSESGGDLGFIMKNQIHPEVSRVMEKLKVGEISNVIKSSLGFHIIQMAEKKDSQAIPFDNVKPDILNHLLKIETEKKLKNYLSDLRKNSEIKVFI